MKQRTLRTAASLLAAGISVLVASAALAAPPSDEQLAEPAWIQAGRAKFVATCGYCHGTEGDAGKHRPFRERIQWDAQQIHDVIANGRQRGANVMPAWKDSIADEEIWQIVAYIKSLSGKPKSMP